MTQDTQEHLHYAGFWVRVAACLIDMVVYTPIYLALKWLISSPPYASEVLFMLVALFSYAWFFASRWQGSPGMHAMKIHIRAASGGRLSFLHALAWGVVGTVGWVVCFAGVLYLNARFDLDAVNSYLSQAEEAGRNIELDDPVLNQLLGMPVMDYVVMVFVALGVTAVLALIWALSIAMPKNKTGFHNVLCRTRFIKGRP